MRLAASGEAWPDMRSLASNASAAGSGSWSLRVIPVEALGLAFIAEARA